MSSSKLNIKIETKVVSGPTELFDLMKKIGIFVPTKSASDEVAEVLYQKALESGLTTEHFADLADIVQGSSLEPIFEKVGDRLFTPIKTVPPVRHVKKKL